MSVANELKARFVADPITFETTDGSSHLAFTWVPPINSANMVVVIHIVASAKTDSSTKAAWYCWPVPLAWVTNANIAIGTIALSSSAINGGFTGTTSVTVGSGNILINVTGELFTTYEWMITIDAATHKFDRV